MDRSPYARSAAAGLFLCALGAASCAVASPGAATPPSPVAARPEFAAGLDCDDAHATVTDECPRGIRPEHSRSAPSALPPRLFGAIGECAGSSDPSCRHIVDCPAAGDPIPRDSSGVEFGTLAAAVFCPAGSPAGGITAVCASTPGGPYVRSVSPRSWIDACASAGSQRILVSSDEGVTAVALPFHSSFYGVPYSTVRVSANGYLSFSDAAPQWVNSLLPTSSVPNSIFAFWDDLILRPTGVCVATVGNAPDRTFAVEWLDAGFFPANTVDTHLTFEALLDERSGTIDVRYLQMTGEGNRATGGSATVGVQQGAGSSFDLVAYNTPGVIQPGAAFRWTPSATAIRCSRGEYRRVFDGGCATPSDPTNIPVWGALTYSATVPTGSSIHLAVRVAETAAALATAAVYRLPDAPRGATAASVLTSLDLGAWLRALHPLLERARFVELRADLDPGAAFDSPPTLGSLELQFNCVPSETPTMCHGGASCAVTNLCHQGQIQCDADARPQCVDLGPIAAGTGCGVGLVCSAAGACEVCDEGAACAFPDACVLGRVSCATGSAQCVAGASRPAGTVCGVSNNGNYARGASAFGWFEACTAPSHSVILGRSADGAESVPLPFAFRFYGTARTDVMISANGYLAFPNTPVNWINAALPEVSFGDAVLPFWDDLVMRDGVCLATYGTAPDRLFVVQWSNADLEGRGGTGDAGARLNFEVVLEEASQALSVLYGTMEGDARATGSGATLGIQSADAIRFDQVGFNRPGAVAAGTSLRWSPAVSGICDGSGACSTCTFSEVCDGRDNNCNALIDDGVPDITCGVGVCVRTGPGCLRGAVPTCVPGAPGVETCNGLDDDCDGMIDEGCRSLITCPANLTMNAGDTINVTVTTNNGLAHNLTWSIASGPTGGASSAGWNPSTVDALTEAFRPILVGVYTIEVHATNGLGLRLSCFFNVTAQGHGVRVELTWDGVGDLDLHLHNGNHTRWYDSTPDDCYYARTSTGWGAGLDLDNVTANGPENVRIDTPTVGADYTVGVHDYADGNGRRATVTVYCGPGTTPVSTFVSAPLHGSQVGSCTNNDFWRVARITPDSAGRCTVAPIDTVSGSTNACATF